MVRDACTSADRISPAVRIVYEEGPDSAPLDAARAIPLALIASELMVNAIRHAYASPSHATNSTGEDG